MANGSSLSLEDIYSQLSKLFNGGGSDQGNGVTTFAQPNNSDSMNGVTASGGLLGNQSQTFNNTGAALPGTVTGAANAGSGLGAGLGMNIGTGQLALGGLGALSGIWGAYNSNKLANQQFNFTKDTTNTNLNNQIKSYNTALEDRITARAATQGQDSAYVNEYLNKNRLTR